MSYTKGKTGKVFILNGLQVKSSFCLGYLIQIPCTLFIGLY